MAKILTLILILLHFTLLPVLAQQPTKIVPPPFEGTKELPLPGLVKDVCLGGYGRYILLHFPDLKKIGVVDVNVLKIAGYIPANDDNIHFAAGATKVLVLNSNSGVLTRWNLQTLERELSQSVQLQGSATRMLMGWNTEGPAIISSGERHASKVVEVDLPSLKATPITFEGNPNRSIGVHSRISAGGETISVWEYQISPSGLQSYFREGQKWVAKYEHESVGQIIPTADGRYLMTGTGVFTRELQRTTDSRAEGQKLLIPASNGPFAIAASVANSNGPQGDNKKGQLFLIGDSRPMANDVPVLSVDMNLQSNPELPASKRIVFIPDAKVIAQIPITADKLIFTQYDVEETLRNSGRNYLLVYSRPKENLSLGEMFEYQVECMASSTKLTYKLDSAPNGMTISETGKVRWQPQKNSLPQNAVLISVAGTDGQEAFHSFKLSVNGATGTDEPTSSSESKGARPNSPKVEVATLENQREVIRLPSQSKEIVVGGSGRYLLLNMPELKKIAVFDVSLAKITGYLPAADDQTRIAATKDKAIVVSANQGVISKWNLSTLEKELTVTSPFDGPIQSIAAGSAASGPAIVNWAHGSGALSGKSHGFLDVETLRKIDVSWPSGQMPHSVFRDVNNLYAASNGTYFSIGGIGPLMLSDRKITAKYVSGGVEFIPSPDGKFYSSNGKLFNFDHTSLMDNSTNLGMVIPPVTGSYFLTCQFANTRDSQKSACKLYMYGENRPLLTLPEISLEMLAGDIDPHHWLKRLAFVPDAKLLVSLSTTNDKLILQRLDVDEALEKSGIDYLVVTSQPEATGKLGETFQYPIQVKTKKGGLQFRLDSYPKGMIISHEGKVTWKIPSSWNEASNQVIVSITDSVGQEVYHTFRIEVPMVREQAAKRESDIAAQRKASAASQRLSDLREKRQKLIELRAKRQSEAPKAIVTRTNGTASASFPSRTWEDSTGSYTIQAAFSRIDDKKKVVLIDEKGEEKIVPLERLSAEDIYHAVECDIKRKSSQSIETSPFQEQSNVSESVNSHVALANELEARITELIAYVENEPMQVYFPKVFTAETIAKLNQLQFPSEMEFKLNLLEILFQANPDAHKLKGNIVSIGQLKMRKVDGNWFITEDE